MKRIVSFVLSLFIVFCLSSCDTTIPALTTEKTIAAKYASANEIACEEYISDGFKKVTYSSSSDVVLAVETIKLILESLMILS